MAWRQSNVRMYRSACFFAFLSIFVPFFGAYGQDAPAIVPAADPNLQEKGAPPGTEVTNSG
jgi:hypothetical protein